MNSTLREPIAPPPPGLVPIGEGPVGPGPIDPGSAAPAPHDPGVVDPPPADPLARAVATVAWVIVFNKPIYPLYVWYFVGNGVVASLATMFGLPLYLALPWLAQRSSLGVRLAFPLVALVDTLFATKLFGQGAGTEMFLAPAALIAALSYRAGEAWWARGVAALLFAGFVATHGQLGAALHEWSAADLARLAEVNAYAVASLTVFVIWRFAALSRR